MDLPHKRVARAMSTSPAAGMRMAPGANFARDALRKFAMARFRFSGNFASCRCP